MLLMLALIYHALMPPRDAFLRQRVDFITFSLFIDIATMLIIADSPC